VARGSTVKRGSTWSYIIYVGTDPETGKRKQQWVGGFRTKRLAEEACAAAIGDLGKGTYVPPVNKTTAVYLREWLAAARASLRPSTADSYETLINLHLIPHIGHVAVQKLTPPMLIALYAKLSESGRVYHKGKAPKKGEPPKPKGGLSPRTVRYCHTILHKALKDGVRWGQLQRNVAEYADVPKQNSTGATLKTWTAKELRTFLASVADDRLYAAYVLTSTTGMRRGEALGVRWQDIDLDRAQLSVRQTLGLVRYKLVLTEPKTASSRRNIALDPMTVEALKAHKARQLEERLKLGLGRAAPDALVFTTLEGDPVHPEGFSETFQRNAKNAGLPIIRFHDLRHTWATLALSSGIHPKVVQERLGHSNIAVTLNTYSHVVPGMQESAAVQVASLLFVSPNN
jgi:integrase